VYPVIELQIQCSGHSSKSYHSVDTGCVIQLGSVYIHVKFSTFQFPLLHVACCDLHEFGHVSLSVLYHVTTAQCHVVHHHGNSQEDALSGVHDAYS
jgi:hypothetical protein